MKKWGAQTEKSLFHQNESLKVQAPGLVGGLELGVKLKREVAVVIGRGPRGRKNKKKGKW